MSVDLSELVDYDGGQISSRVFSDPAIFEREMKRVFERSWLFLAHECQLPAPGDFFSTWMGNNPVLVVRQKDGGIRAFVNSCRHRGNRVCRADEGRARSFMCNYHGWTYNLAGDLISVPHEEQFPGLDKSRTGLLQVAQLDTYKGFIFATFDKDAPPLVDYLGEAAWYFDAFVDRIEGGAELVGGVNKWIVKANWKFGAEQFTSDMYHLLTNHLSAMVAMVDEGAPPMELPEDGRQFSSPQGHGMGFFFNANMQDFGLLDKYYEAMRPQIVERIGEARARGPMISHGNIFPNLGFLPGTGVLRVFHPRGPGEMEIWSWVVVDKAAPAEVKEAQRLFTVRTFTAAGIFEQDDSETWADCQRNATASVVRDNPWLYQMNLGRSGPDGDYPGNVSFVLSEEAARGFYRRYVELMTEQP